MAPIDTTPLFERFESARHCGSSLTKAELVDLRERYSIPPEFKLILAASTSRPTTYYPNRLVLFSDYFRQGLRLPLPESVRRVCTAYNLVPAVFGPNSFSILEGMSRFFAQMGAPWSMEVFTYLWQIRSSGAFLHLSSRHRALTETVGLPSTSGKWRGRFFFVELAVGDFGVPTKSGPPPEGALMPSRGSAAIKDLLAWMARRKCFFYLADPARPKVQLQEVEAEESPKGKGSRDRSAAGQEAGPSRKRARLMEAVFGEDEPAGPSRSDPEGEAVELSSSSSPAGEAEEAEEEAEAEGGAAPASIVWNSDQSKAKVRVPHPRSLYGKGSGSFSLDLASLVRNQPDWDEMDSYGTGKLIRHCLTESARAFHDTTFLACGLERARHEVTSGLEKLEVEVAARKAARSDVGKLKGEVKSLAAEVAELQLRLGTAESRVEEAERQAEDLRTQLAEARSLARPDTDEGILELFRGSRAYSRELAGFGRIGFDLLAQHLSKTGVIDSRSLDPCLYDKLVLGDQYQSESGSSGEFSFSSSGGSARGGGLETAGDEAGELGGGGGESGGAA